MLALGVLAACSSARPPARSAADYRAHAQGDYSPPGPPNDPWGPYIVRAADRFDVPERWIREVMQVESGGRLYHGGQLVTSGAGAMGLMQVMPGTYEELRARYELGDDPYHPHDNIMAGTAYIREMYDLYGAPGFLAAYNAGPRRFEDYAYRKRGLPNETRRYVARIAPNIMADRPKRESDAAVLALYQMPLNGGPIRRATTGPVALAAAQPPREAPARAASVVAANLPPPTPVAVAQATLPPPPAPPPESRRGGFALIPSAVAGSLAARSTAPGAARLAGDWAIQVGAFGNAQLARAANEAARSQARDLLVRARPAVGTVRQGRNTLYRARLGGLSREAAMQACDRLSRGRGSCIVLSPDAQS